MSLPATLTQSNLPILHEAGSHASDRFIEFFTARIRNPNTRRAYLKAAVRFLDWCQQMDLALVDIESVHVATYIEGLQQNLAKSSVKLHLSAIRHLFDWLVIGHVLTINPATAVRGPKLSTKTGKTPVMSADQARELLDSIDGGKIGDLRDRALIAALTYTAGRIGAVLNLKVKDYHPQGKTWFLNLHEKGGKFHPVPCHHKLVEYLDAYINAAGIAGDKNAPLFRTLERKKGRPLSSKALAQAETYQMLKRRAKKAGIIVDINNHTFRATAITTLLQNGAELEQAQALANHADVRTTRLYDRRKHDATQAIVEKIDI